MSRKLTEFKELNSLRALAVIMTVASHWQTRIGLEKVPYLWYGVDIFFVISGFLITRTLLQINQAGNKLMAIKNFYIRRSLRLFPAYYLLIVVFFLGLNCFDLYIWDNQWNLYYFTYLPNFYWFAHPNSGNGSFNHIWSLGVEEQFYLLWPWFIVFLPLKRIKAFILSNIAIAIFLHGCLSALPKNGMLPFFNLHTLGIGALIAYYHFQKPTDKYYQKLLLNATSVLFISCICFLSLLLFHPLTDGLNDTLLQICLCIGAGMLVIKSVYGWGQYAGLFFRNRHIQFIGTISYGIYLYHMPVPDTVKALLHKIGYQIDYNENPFLSLLLFCTISFTIALLSYKLLEMPFLRLKTRFALVGNIEKGQKSLPSFMVVNQGSQ